MVSFLSSKSRKVKDERGGGAHKSAAPLHARAMTAASTPPAELPAPGAGCEGDNSQQLAAARCQRTAKEPYRRL